MDTSLTDLRMAEKNPANKKRQGQGKISTDQPSDVVATAVAIQERSYSSPLPPTTCIRIRAL